MAEKRTANQAILEGMIIHQIALMRYSTGLTKKIIALLDATEDDLRIKLEKKIARLVAKNQPIEGSAAIARLKVLDAIVKQVRGDAFASIQEELRKELTKLAKVEAVVTAGRIETEMPVILDLVQPEPTVLAAVVKAKPFEGKVLKDWVRNAQRSDLDRITAQLRIGMVQGESSQQIVRRIVGTGAMKGADGVTQLTRTQVESITRTATNFFANEARNALFAANSDIIDEELFVATLDARTTAVCRANDGKIYPLGTGPMPPLHFRCRSLRVAVFDGKIVGDRPMKPTTEKELVQEYAMQNNLGNIKTRAALPHGYKGDFDAWARKRTRELIGQTPATTSYQKFLEAQSVTFQEEVLGKTKAKLFRKGGLPLDKFVERNGTELTLAQLADRYASYFRKAGLDPKDFT